MGTSLRKTIGWFLVTVAFQLDAPGVDMFHRRQVIDDPMLSLHDAACEPATDGNPAIAGGNGRQKERQNYGGILTV